MSTEMVRPDTDLDRTIDQASTRFADTLGALAASPVVREGMLKAGVCSLVLALEREFPDCLHVLSSVLKVQGQIIDDEQAARL